MTQSKCPACPSTSFEFMKTTKVPGLAKLESPYWFFQCASCGAVVGAVDYHCLSDILDRLEGVENSVRMLRTR